MQKQARISGTLTLIYYVFISTYFKCFLENQKLVIFQTVFSYCIFRRSLRRLDPFVFQNLFLK